jgi:dihydroorotate dehydrogenase (NAD+) catalytic subunit
MIELAPRHKYGLTIGGPVMPATGAFGYGDAYQDLVDLSLLGAIVTNPVSLRPRRASRGQRIGVHGEAFVVHTGWPNPGLRRLVREARETWARLPAPVIVHILASSPREVGQAAAQLSTVSGVGAIELGFLSSVSHTLALELVGAAAAEGDLPVIAQVPFDRVDDLAPRLARHGVDALTLTAPPRAVLPLEVEPLPPSHSFVAGMASPVEEEGGQAEAGVARYLRGRLYGRALFPLLLNILSRWAQRLPVPVIACGGIASVEDALACLTLGAAAVQLDALIWREPSLVNTIARALMEPQDAEPAQDRTPGQTPRWRAVDWTAGEEDL